MLLLIASNSIILFKVRTDNILATVHVLGGFSLPWSTRILEVWELCNDVHLSIDVGCCVVVGTGKVKNKLCDTQYTWYLAHMVKIFLCIQYGKIEIPRIYVFLILFITFLSKKTKSSFYERTPGLVLMELPAICCQIKV